jgi:hypothetical protein
VLATYWAEVGDISEFRVLLSSDGIRPLIHTKTGQKIVGGIIRYKNAKGNLCLLPYIDFDREDYTFESEEDEKDYWTEKAVSFGNKFVSSICTLSKALNNLSGLSPQPVWLAVDKYSLPKEEKIREKIVTIDSKINALQNKKERYEQEIADESILKRLLYENGKPLEEVIQLSLEILGFRADHFENSESEFDVVFESKEGRLIGEVEGKDNKAINITKLRQLEMNIHEDFERDGVTKIAKGVLFGNAYRLVDPEEREEYFTEKCIIAANRNGTALIRTVDLFYTIKYLLSNKDKTFAKSCRKAIIDTVGIVSFPTIPYEKVITVVSDE